jgi:hypothetical protein
VDKFYCEEDLCFPATKRRTRSSEVCPVPCIQIGITAYSVCLSSSFHQVSLCSLLVFFCFMLNQRACAWVADT